MYQGGPGEEFGVLTPIAPNPPPRHHFAPDDDEDEEDLIGALAPRIELRPLY